MQQKSRAHRATAPTYTYKKTHECNLHLQKTQKAELFNSKKVSHHNTHQTTIQ